MKILYRVMALAGLLMLLIPSLLFYLDRMPEDRMKTLMLLGTLIWFSGAIPWLGRKTGEGD